MSNVTNIQDGKLAKRRYHNAMAIFKLVQRGVIAPRKKAALQSVLQGLRNYYQQQNKGK